MPQVEVRRKKDQAKYKLPDIKDYFLDKEENLVKSKSLAERLRAEKYRKDHSFKIMQILSNIWEWIKK